MSKKKKKGLRLKRRREGFRVSGNLTFEGFVSLLTGGEKTILSRQPEGEGPAFRREGG